MYIVGDVALNNLKLKKDALDDLELPIEIVEGSFLIEDFYIFIFMVLI